ncbi:MAG: hypothetical protein QOE97_2558 [Pseudonocardiales bacterium]|nr:hypothetical protein [Pseudonocardiales bacterium]
MTLPVLLDLAELAATRAALHATAERMAAEQYAANTELALTATEGGFATGWFPGDGDATVRLSVSGPDLVRESGARVTRTPLDGVDPAAEAVLVAWWSLGSSVLSGLDAGADAISPVILWPEHFDIAVTVTTPDGRGLNLGFSPGDDFSSQPYVYAGPWEKQAGTFWNAPFGAVRTYSQVAVGDPAGTSAAFLADARSVFAAG